jgi:serine phosphatase RsbU (regulator of sigma subunit)
LLLGFLPDATYMNREIALEDGDRLLFYTDGIPETRNPKGDFFDEARMRRWLASTEDRDATHFIDAALGELSAWHAGGGFEDDVTFVVARFSASESQPHVEQPFLSSASADSSRLVAKS